MSNTSTVNTNILIADVHRAAKRIRAERAALGTPSRDTDAASGTLANAIAQEAASLFVRYARGLGNLPREVALYWLDTLHLTGCAIDDGLPDSDIDRLCAMLSFITGGGDCDAMTREDWEELADMVDDAAEELPIDSLTSMMSTLLEKGML